MHPKSSFPSLAWNRFNFDISRSRLPSGTSIHEPTPFRSLPAEGTYWNRVLKLPLQSRLMRRLFVLSACLFGGFTDTAEAQYPPPNIVLIMADDLGRECLGCYGSEEYLTPNLDALAESGIRFTHCFSQPLCTPTRVQLMTGLYNHRNYIRFGLLDPEATTFGRILKNAGYVTGIFGKWQLEGGLAAPTQFGFDEHCLWQVNRRPSRYANPGLEINGEQVDFTLGEYGPDIVCDHACRFISEHANRQPFFLYYPMILPHAPFEPTPGDPEYNPANFDGSDGSGGARHFPGMVAHIDQIVGRILASLDDNDVRETTVVIFTGDNGTGRQIRSQLGDREIRGGKGLTINDGSHVPLIAAGQFIEPGRVCDDLVNTVDLFATVVDLAWANQPIETDGISIKPRLYENSVGGEEVAPRQWSYCWYERSGDRALAVRYVQTTRYKLYSDGRFFDTASDPLEESPLADAALTEELRQLRDALASRLTEVEAGFVDATQPLW